MDQTSTDAELADPVGTLTRLVAENRRIHEVDCVNLNPAANVMNPAAEALLATGLGTRPSLGDPGDKYETGLEAVERIEVLAASLARRVFGARHVELRLPSGAVANLAAFHAASSPGDAIISPPSSIAGHVTHHAPSAAGLAGLRVHPAPVDARRYSVDVDAVAALARSCRPAVITIGGSLNLRHHPVADLRTIADEVGATLVFDAAHLSGLIAGGRWPDPLREGAHVMTMSTYKSLGGPPAGLIATDDDELASRLSVLAFPGLTANFDVANTAALARTLVDWEAVGQDYADEMLASAWALADELSALGVPVHRPVEDEPATTSHAFAVDAHRFGDGNRAARWFRRANLLSSAIGVPAAHDPGVDAPAVRIGSNEFVRWGMTRSDMPRLAELVARAWFGAEDDLGAIGTEVSDFRRRFDRVCFAT